MGERLLTPVQRAAQASPLACEHVTRWQLADDRRQVWCSGLEMRAMCYGREGACYMAYAGR
jgi:hypothetical protein